MHYGVGTPALTTQSSWGGVAYPFYPGTNVTGLAIGADGTLYVSCAGGLLCALNPDRTERWRFTRPAITAAGATVAPDGGVFLPLTVSDGSAQTGELVRLSRAGQPLWTNRFSGAIKATPALSSDGTVWVTDVSGRLTLLSASGQPLGQHAAAGLGSEPLITSDKAIVVSTSGWVFAFASAPAATPGWPMLGRDAQRSHRDSTATPPPPPALVSASTNAERVTISWTPSVESAVAWEVWRGRTTNVTEAGALAALFGPESTYTDTNVITGYVYYYWVRARNSLGAGDFQGPAIGYPSTGGRDVWRYQIPGFRDRRDRFGRGGRVCDS